MIRRYSAFVLLVLLGGCTSLGPFEGPQAAADEHTLCYTRMATSPDQLQTVAKTACGGGEPRFQRQEMDLSACPLLIPERLYFACGAS